MTFGEAARTWFSKFFAFSGRAFRPEYRLFFLFIVIWNIFADIIIRRFFTQVAVTETEMSKSVTATSSGPIQSIVGRIVFSLHLAVTWRRMHDTGRSGLQALMPILLFLGAFVALIFGIGIASGFQHGGMMDIFFTRATLLNVISTLLVLFVAPLLGLLWLTLLSQTGTNRYGPNPYEVAS